MAHKAPHRQVTIVMPLEDFQQLDRHAANSRRSKNQILLEWLQPRIARLRKRPTRPPEEPTP